MKISKKDLESMRVSGTILSEALDFILSLAQPGAIPNQIDQKAREFVFARDAKPAFLGFRGFPYALCVSRNDAIVHGIPDDAPLRNGELVGFDFGVLYKGMYTDAARTVCIGACGDPVNEKLIKVARDSFDIARKIIRPGIHTGDIGHAVQTYVESKGFGVIRSLVGHGIGRELHGDPRVPNFGTKGEGAVLEEGMAIAVEPMISAGNYQVKTDSDGWTIKTLDGSLTAHFEETLYITKNGCDILTA